MSWEKTISGGIGSPDPKGGHDDRRGWGPGALSYMMHNDIESKGWVLHKLVDREDPGKLECGGRVAQKAQELGKWWRTKMKRC